VSLEISPWSDRVRLVDARYEGARELPILAAVASPQVVVIRPDGHVAWVGEMKDVGLAEAIATWFGAAESAH
jgi:3-(3-hydroxy-phenyl)propionate hydroxylase